MVFFRVSPKILSDPDFQSLSLADMGRWTMLGVLTAQQGLNGILTLPRTAETFLALFRYNTWLALKEMILRIPNVTVEEDLASKSLVITWKNWEKYQNETKERKERKVGPKKEKKEMRSSVLELQQRIETGEGGDVRGGIGEDAKAVLKFLNEKTGRHFRPVAVNLDMIAARLQSGATVENCKGVIARKVREWKHDPKMAQFLRPATLFNRTKFEQYVGVREGAWTEGEPYANPIRQRRGA